MCILRTRFNSYFLEGGQTVEVPFEAIEEIAKLLNKISLSESRKTAHGRLIYLGMRRLGIILFTAGSIDLQGDKVSAVCPDDRGPTDT